MFFSFDCNIIDTKDVLNIRKYLTKNIWYKITFGSIKNKYWYKTMFRLSKNVFIASLSFSRSLGSIVNVCDHTKFISSGNQTCMT